jgi:hypothetical protein
LEVLIDEKHSLFAIILTFFSLEHQYQPFTDGAALFGFEESVRESPEQYSPSSGLTSSEYTHATIEGIDVVPN